MHRYLHNYEDFLLIDDDYVARVGSRRALGPKRRPHGGSFDDDDDGFESYEDEYDQEYDERDDDDDYDDSYDSR